MAVQIMLNTVSIASMSNDSKIVRPDDERRLLDSRPEGKRMREKPGESYGVLGARSKEIMLASEFLGNIGARSGAAALAAIITAIVAVPERVGGASGQAGDCGQKE